MDLLANVRSLWQNFFFWKTCEYLPSICRLLTVMQQILTELLQCISYCVVNIGFIISASVEYFLVGKDVSK